MGIMAAFVFAAQMLNFPVAGGTSGHLLGATFVAILLGPWAMILVMTCVIAVQALLFQDGGLLALGFNIVNMGILSGLVGYLIYVWINGIFRKAHAGSLFGAGVGAWTGVVIAASATVLQLAISETTALGIALPAMVGIHALIGLGEALITVAALIFIRQTRPELLDQSAQHNAHGSTWVAVGFIIALATAFASPLASPHPDGLERVAEDQGFLGQSQESVYTVLPDYTVPFIQSEIFTTIAAGIIGVLVVSCIVFVIAKVSTKRQDDIIPPSQSSQTQ
jgi:cobalt/nickel transport system permease protein